jgi:hypothetical protein
MKSRNSSPWMSPGAVILPADVWNCPAGAEHGNAQAGKTAKVRAKQLTKEFADDKKAAEKTYPMNLIVEVEGEVKKAEKLAATETWAVHLAGRL